jgi:hypothetical protein
MARLKIRPNRPGSGPRKRLRIWRKIHRGRIGRLKSTSSRAAAGEDGRGAPQKVSGALRL